MKDPVLLVIVGPTGSGKSALGLHLCARYHGEIVNCDSMQIYRGMDIGTGKPTQAQRSGINHHLLDVVDPRSVFSAGEYAQQVRALLPSLRERGALPVVVGGTGLYLRSLLEGLFDGPPRDEKFRTRLHALIARGGLRHLHSWLARVDPESAVRIMPRDIPRIVRALEVYVLTGITLSRHFRSDRKPLQGWNIIKLGLNPPREELYQRINDRVQEMLASGWINEVRALLESGVNPRAQAFAALGYRRVVEHLQGRLELAAMVSCIQADTRHYAKRQWTWFRKDRDIHWLDGFGTFPEVQQTAAEWLANEL